MGSLIPILLELLSAAPTVATDVQAEVAAWNASHGNVAKTATAVSAAQALIAAAGAVAQTVETAATAAPSVAGAAA
jgi:hypothetical protein